MRKSNLLIIFCLLFSILLTGCNDTKSPSSLETIHKIEANELAAQTIIHERLTDSLPNLKSLVEKSLKEVDYLDWEQFSKISEIREFKTLPEEFYETTSFYAAGSSMLVVCPKFFALESGDQKTYALIHELIHSLVGTGRAGEESSMNLFVEGVTDYFSSLVLGDTLDYSLTYQNELYCLSWLMESCGPNNVAKAICDGTILDLVDDATRTEGSGAKLHNALAILDKSPERNEVKQAIMDEMDILSTLSDEPTSKKYIEIFNAAYAPYLN